MLVRIYKKNIFRILSFTLSLILFQSGSFLFNVKPVNAETVNAEEYDKCVYESAQAVWGVKESFRAYISGAIAGGAWQTVDGASYETPYFHFPLSSTDSNFSKAKKQESLLVLSFGGGVKFSGHNDLLNLRISNLELRFNGQKNVALAADLYSNDPNGEPVVDEQDVAFATGKIESVAHPADNISKIIIKPVILESEGVAAFSNFYEKGAELDPVTVEITSSCKEGNVDVFDYLYSNELPTVSDSKSNKNNESNNFKTEKKPEKNNGNDFTNILIISLLVIIFASGGFVVFLILRRK